MAQVPTYTRGAIVVVVATTAFVAFVTGLAAGGGELADLKEWQTFIAAMVALGAASLAYRGAMAKVTLEREVIARDARRRLLSLALRLELTLLQLKAEAAQIVAPFDGPLLQKHSAVPDQLHTGFPPELNEAWEHLDLFPQELVLLIASLRRDVHRLRDECGKVIGQERIEWSGFLSPISLRRFERLLRDIIRNSEAAAEAIRKEIDRVQ